MHPLRKIAASLALGLLGGWIAGQLLHPVAPLPEKNARVEAPPLPAIKPGPDWQSWLDASAPLSAPESAADFWLGNAELARLPASRQELYRDTAYALLPEAAFSALLSDPRFIALNPEKLQTFLTEGNPPWKPSWWLRLWQSGPANAIRATGTLPSVFLNLAHQRHLSESLARTDPEIGMAWVQTLHDPYNPLVNYLEKVASHDVDKAKALWSRQPSGGPTKYRQATAAFARRITASAIMREWARTDWEAPMAWAAAQLPREDAQQAVGDMFRHIGAEKSRQVLEAAGQIADPAVRSLAYSHTLTADRGSAMESLVEKAVALPENALDKAGWGLLGQRSAGLIPRTSDPVAAAAKLTALAGRVPEAFREGFIQHAAMMAGWNNKPLAGQLLEYLPDVNAEIMAGDWVEQDPMAASTWLASLPHSRKRDLAVTGFCRALSSLDAKSAADWALTLQDAALKASAVQDALGAWNQKDPATAAAWAAEKGVN